MASGVHVAKACEEEFQNMKLRHMYRYIVYRLNDDLTEIIVEKTAPTTSTYEDMIADLKAAQAKKQCRYCIFDCEYDLKGMNRTKLVFFYWGPEDSTIKQKMVYSASKEKLRSILGTGIGKVIQANDDDDLDWNNVMSVINSTSYS